MNTPVSHCKLFNNSLSIFLKKNILEHIIKITYLQSSLATSIFVGFSLTDRSFSFEIKVSQPWSSKKRVHRSPRAMLSQLRLVAPYSENQKHFESHRAASLRDKLINTREFAEHWRIGSLFPSIN